jgi:hypothetical protein
MGIGTDPRGLDSRYRTSRRTLHLATQLSDSDDEMALEAAVNSQADALVTHNLADFAVAAPRFGLLDVPQPTRLGGHEDEQGDLTAQAAQLDQSCSGTARQRGWRYRLTSGSRPRSRRRLGAVQTAADFFRRRADDAQPEDLYALLTRAPDRAPDLGDERPASGSE